MKSLVVPCPPRPAIPADLPHVLSCGPSGTSVNLGNHDPELIFIKHLPHCTTPLSPG